MTTLFRSSSYRRPRGPFRDVLAAMGTVGIGAAAALTFACSDGDPGFPAGSGGTGSGGTGGAVTGGAPGAGATPGVTGGAPGAGGTATGGSGAGGSGTGGVTGSGTVLVDADFQSRSAGTYSEAMASEDFGFDVPWNNGLDEGRASIVDQAGNQFLRVTYPANEYGPGDAGVQFKVLFGQAYDELYFSYRVRFGAGFEFVKGGKLPGLIGGSAPTGCKPKPDGFSARNMWRGEGRAVQYVYHPSKQSGCGDNLGYESGGQDWKFMPGTWHTLVHRIVMNDKGSANGVMQAWADGELVLDDQSRIWIIDDYEGENGINGLYFSTFFGGGDSSWAPSSEQAVDFDDFVVSTGPIE